MRTAWVIARRELISYLCSPIAAVLLVVFLLVNGYTFWILLSALNDPRSQVNGAVMQLFFGGTLFFWFLVMLMSGALTMRLFAEEKKQGTYELLMTAPVRDGEVVFGKFLGAFLFYALLWIPTLVYPLLLSRYAALDWGPIACGYLGSLVVGALFLAIGQFASALTKNQIISAVVAFTICLLLFSLSFLEFFLPLPQWRGVFGVLNLVAHLDDFGKGVIDTRILVFYSTLILFFLYLTLKGIESRKGIAVATCFILAAFLFFLNLLAYRHPHRWDLTQTQTYTLSDKTVKVLQGLEHPVEIAVFYQPRHSLYKRVFDLLKEFAEKKNQNLKIEYADPDRDPARTQQMTTRLKVDELNTLVVSSGGKIKQIRDTDLEEYDFSARQLGESPKIKNFTGEEALLNAILAVTEERQPVLYFLTGHGEKDIDSFANEGIAATKLFLEKNNMKGEKLLLLGRKEIPSPCDLLVVAGPTKPVTPPEKELLKKYLEGGGSLWLMIDPLTETGLGPLLEEWGVGLGNDVVVDPSTGIPHISAANLFIHSYSRHPITKNMLGVATLFVMARSVAAAPSTAWRSTPLAFTSNGGWGETSVMSQQFEFSEKEDLKGPVSIAVAAEAAAASSEKGRLVVVGDSEFLTNTQLENVGNTDLVDNILQWLLRHEKRVSLKPKTPEQIELHLTSQQMTRLFWATVLGMPFLGLTLGGIAFWRRNRY